MKIQRQSEGLKKGNGQTHDQAVENVVQFLKQHKLNYYIEWYQKFKWQFNKQNGLRPDYAHSYDLAIPDKKLFIEIDGEKHSKKNQKINDGIAEKYAKEELGFTTIRLDKVECIGDLEDRQLYLTRILWRYLR